VAYDYFERLGVPIRYVADSTLSKEALVQELAHKEGISTGPICLLACVEPCLSFQLRGDRQAKQLRLLLEHSKCTHLYHFWHTRNLVSCTCEYRAGFPLALMFVLTVGNGWLGRWIGPGWLTANGITVLFGSKTVPRRSNFWINNYTVIGPGYWMAR
jgi:hypothetical protein